MSDKQSTHLDKSKRPERVPLHKQKMLSAEKRPGYVRRWVNDVVDRIQQFEKAGWTPVVGESQNTSDKLAQTESQLGSVVRKIVNKDPNAASHWAVLMEIPEDLYNQDQAEKQKENDRVEESYNRVAGADYGKFEKK